MEPVLIQQFFLGCLAHASYIVASEGVAAVIDPQRDVDLYLDFAREKSLSIEHIIETHLHADFVSGHHELAQRTGARIYLGEDAHATFPHTAIKDRDTLQFGNARFDFLHTPGHTIEGVCAVLTDLASPAAPPAVFTCDTLFVCDVAPPPTRPPPRHPPPTTPRPHAPPPPPPPWNSPSRPRPAPSTSRSPASTPPGPPAPSASTAASSSSAKTPISSVNRNSVSPVSAS